MREPSPSADERSGQSGRLQLHHLIACLGLGVVGLGLLLGWQTREDAHRVDTALIAATRKAPPEAQGASLHRTQILFLREARKRRLRNFSLLVIGAGLALIVGASLMRHLRAEIALWRAPFSPSSPSSPAPPDTGPRGEDPPDRRHAA